MLYVEGPLDQHHICTYVHMYVLIEISNGFQPVPNANLKAFFSDGPG